MMRIGICTDLGKSEPQDWAASMKALGCGSVVFPANHVHTWEEADAYAKAARNHDLVIAEVGAWSNPICPDSEKREAAVEKCCERLALADRIGAECCVNIAGSMGAVWDGAYWENLSREAWNLTVKSIQEIIDRVQPVNTCYTIEAMPYMYPTGPDQYLELMEAVDREHFAVHIDICNWMNCPERYFANEEFMEECFEKLGPFIKSCHVKDVNLLSGYTCMLKEVPCGEGNISLEKYAALAEQYNAQMPMLIEHLSTDEAYLQSLAYVCGRLKNVVKLEPGKKNGV